MLAYIYVPLTFVCTLFGMNIPTFGQGSVPLWVFLMMAAIVTSLTVLPVHHDLYDGVRRWILPLRLGVGILLHRPYCGFIYLLYYLTHGSDKVVLLLDAIKKVDGWMFSDDNDMRNSNPILPLAKGISRSVEWQDRITVLLDFMSRPDWNYHYFIYYWFKPRPIRHNQTAVVVEDDVRNDGNV